MSRFPQRPCTRHGLGSFNKLRNGSGGTSPAFITLSVSARKNGHRQLRGRDSGRRSRARFPSRLHQGRRTNGARSGSGGTRSPLFRYLKPQELSINGRICQETKGRRSRARGNRGSRHNSRPVGAPGQVGRTSRASVAVGVISLLSSNNLLFLAAAVGLPNFELFRTHSPGTRPTIQANFRSQRAA